jgi:3-hydroxyacyl-[acyl-carrier-protein] dehydratase
MRFILVDRILRLEMGKEILALKNVCQSEDIFADHFPGRPIMPGCMIVEACDQASRILLGASAGFARLPVLERVVNGKFRRFVQPGDTLQIRATIAGRADAHADIRAAVSGEGGTVAQLSLGYRMVDTAEKEGAAQVCARMREFVDILRADPIVNTGERQGGTMHHSREERSV